MSFGWALGAWLLTCSGAWFVLATTRRFARVASYALPVVVALAVALLAPRFQDGQVALAVGLALVVIGAGLTASYELNAERARDEETLAELKRKVTSLERRVKKMKQDLDLVSDAGAVEEDA